MPGQHRRIGFTLVELLTVVAIIALLLALTAIFFPSFQRRESVSSGADSTAGALLQAKMRAKRDGRPTGLRLIVNPSNPSQYIGFSVIQQPDDFAQGRYTGSSGQQASFTGVNFKVVDPSTGNQAVNPGDFLEINGGGLLYQIGSPVTSTSLTINDSVTAHPLPQATTDVPSSGTGTTITNYRVIRAPQVLATEPTVNLPTGVIIDFSPNYPATGGQPLSLLPLSASGNLDILFAPSGGLVGANLNSPVFLVLRQADGINNAPYSNDLTSYYATIIGVEPRTGFIAAHPVSPSSDPYAFTRDGQSSGM